MLSDKVKKKIVLSTDLLKCQQPINIFWIKSISKFIVFVDLNIDT